jgi:membrane-bound ClpP family serine protease
MVGLTGKALTDIQREGRVLVQGEYWWAHARAPIAQDESVRVRSRHRHRGHVARSRAVPRQNARTARRVSHR